MESRSGQSCSSTSSSIERQLFHGCRDEEVIRAIFRQNFDWRVSGSANDVVYGRGTYFARDASLSARYSAAAKRQRLNWMFLARVLVGRSAVGKREYVRPPPVNPAHPHGELYDSCVNSLDRPTIYVVFDTDQCYPEYVLSYNKIWQLSCSCSCSFFVCYLRQSTPCSEKKSLLYFRLSSLIRHRSKQFLACSFSDKQVRAVQLYSTELTHYIHC